MTNTFQISYQTLSFDELTPADQELVMHAVRAMDGSHSPYSNFQVGSSVELQDGTFYIGSNQENAAYPSGLCAERVALFAAKSQTKQPIRGIAVVARNSKMDIADAFSCGNCRQVMLEYAGQQSTPIKVIMGNHDNQYVVLEDVRHLLPFSFDAKNLVISKA